MPYCSRCGVEVDSGVDACPLCGTPIQKLAESPKTASPRYPEFESDGKPRMSDNARRRLVWEVISLLAGIAILVVLGTDFRANEKLTWSRYPGLGAVLAWIYSTLLLYFRKSAPVLVCGFIVSTAGFLAGVDLLSGSFHWFFRLGLPVLLLFAVLGGLVVLAAIRVRYRGFNIVAFASLAAALLCAGIDALISLYLIDRVELSWSMIVMLVLVPFGAITLFLHYRLRNRFDLRRIFHL